MNEHETKYIFDILLGTCGFLLVAWGRFMWSRVTKLEDRLDDQTRELHSAIDQQGEVFREEHGKLRDQMTKQHDRIVEILVAQKSGGS